MITYFFPNQKLVVGQTLVSQNQVFEIGFFSPGISSNRSLGIWCKSTPDVVVWVANRNIPITASQAPPLFMTSGNGSLTIKSGKSIIWSATSSGVASNPVLQLLETWFFQTTRARERATYGRVLIIQPTPTCRE